ncbi:MAG: ABC transporter substrate-binding protein [Paracoccus denitrificans]|nr:MAG: ABC transporter substrate-binding protein [Paracoccus denitrificans]PZO83833.1 MAG: ABC transporter substrate-binding protein [Paracoccus denitrificans]
MVRSVTIGRALTWLMVLMCIMAISVAHAADITITDDTGREVTLSAPARRIILTDGMAVTALALIDREPATILAGYNRARIDPAALAQLEKGMPGLTSVPDIGDPGMGGSLEGVIALRPDLVILDPFYNRSPQAIRTMEAAGIAVAVIAITPLPAEDHPHDGLRRLGVLTGRSEAANAYADWADARLANIRKRAATVAPGARPAVLIEAHAGRGKCCLAVGAGRGIGEFVDLVGGINIGAEVLSGMAGELSPEYVLARAPQVYIATGGPYLAGTDGLVIGPGVSEAEAEAGLSRVVQRLGIEGTPAQTAGQVHGIWHGLAVSAFNIVAMEAVARWTNPTLFADIDPRLTMDEINTRFLAAPLAGALWVSPEGNE